MEVNQTELKALVELLNKQVESLNNLLFTKSNENKPEIKVEENVNTNLSKILDDKIYLDLLKLESFDLSKYDYNLLLKLFKECDNYEVLLHFVKKVVNSTYKFTELNTTLGHLVFNSKFVALIEDYVSIADKEVFMCKDNNGNTPFHYLLMNEYLFNNNLENYKKLIKYLLLEAKLSYSDKNNENLTVMDMIADKFIK